MARYSNRTMIIFKHIIVSDEESFALTMHPYYAMFVVDLIMI